MRQRQRQGQITVDGKSEECFNVDRKNFPVKAAFSYFPLMLCGCVAIRIPDMCTEAGGYIGFTAWSGRLTASTVVLDSLLGFC